MGQEWSTRTRFWPRFELTLTSNSPILRIAKVAILGWGISRFLLVLADFFTPGFEVLFHLCHELVGYCAVDQAMIVA